FVEDDGEEINRGDRRTTDFGCGANNLTPVTYDTPAYAPCGFGDLCLAQHSRPPLPFTVAGEARVRTRVQIRDELARVVTVAHWDAEHGEVVRADARDLWAEEEAHGYGIPGQRFEFAR